MAPKKNAAATSLRAYAKHRGESPESVSKAIKTGRLRESVLFIKGQPKIANVEMADREWAANTTPRANRGATEDEDLPDGVPSFNVSRAVREFHAARREAALADSAEDDRDEKREELVPAQEARDLIIDKFTVVKTKMLGVAPRLSQRLPEYAEKVAPVVDELIREALEELAVEVDGDGEEEDAEEE